MGQEGRGSHVGFGPVVQGMSLLPIMMKYDTCISGSGLTEELVKGELLKMGKLAGKVAVITGAGSGIGRASRYCLPKKEPRSWWPISCLRAVMRR